MNNLEKFERDSKNILDLEFKFKHFNGDHFVYEYSDGCEIFMMYLNIKDAFFGLQKTIKSIIKEGDVTYLKLVTFCAYSYEKEDETIYVDL